MKSEAVVFRQVNLKAHFPPDAKRPLPIAFRPTAADKEHARQTGQPVMLSVWDSALTRDEEATAIRQQLSGRELESQPFCWTVQTIRDQSRPGATPLDVVREPLQPRCGPGADGHAGITGLDDADNPDKLIRRLYRKRLSESCSPGTSVR